MRSLKTRFVCISDTHSKHRNIILPAGDILLHCGDVTEKGTRAEALDFDIWINSTSFKYKVVIGGNHDFCFVENDFKAKELLPNCHYLCDESLVIEGIRIYGFPWYIGPWAFGLKLDDFEKKVIQIPSDTDILMTHYPPFTILDEDFRNKNRGSAEILNVLKILQPKLVCFGHEHNSYGYHYINTLNTWALNASICDNFNDASRKPLIFDFHHRTKHIELIE